jgi:hypothetical protein
MEIKLCRSGRLCKTGTKISQKKIIKVLIEFSPLPKYQLRSRSSAGNPSESRPRLLAGGHQLEVKIKIDS